MHTTDVAQPDEVPDGGSGSGATDPARRRWSARNTIIAVAVGSAGLAGGAIIGSTVSAGAATTSTTAPASTSGGTRAATCPGGPWSAHALASSGTVTAVGASTVTIKTSTATTTYAVTSSSDIDKNGEAKLSDLAVGDAVTFVVDSSASTPTIAVLHAGSDALDHPSGAARGGFGPGGWPGGPGARTGELPAG